MSWILEEEIQVDVHSPHSIRQALSLQPRYTEFVLLYSSSVTEQTCYFLMQYFRKKHMPFNSYYKKLVHRRGTSGSMRACHAAGPGSIPGRDKFPGWGFFGGFSSPVRRMSGSFRTISPRISFAHHNHPSSFHYGRQWPEMLKYTYIQWYFLILGKHLLGHILKYSSGHCRAAPWHQATPSMRNYMSSNYTAVCWGT